MTGGEYYRAMVEAVRSRGNHFKAVRPDGTWFFDQKIRRASPVLQGGVSAMVYLIQCITFAA